MQPALLEGGRIGREVVGLAPRAQCFERGFGREHSGLDRRVRALDARGVEKPGVVAHQRTSGECELGQRLQAARGDRARAVRDAPGAREESADRRVRLVALEFLERMEVGILVAEADHEPDRDLVILEVVEEGAAVCVVGERPSRGVHHEPGHVALGLHFPELLQADTVDLRSAPFA